MCLFNNIENYTFLIYNCRCQIYNQILKTIHPLYQWSSCSEVQKWIQTFSFPVSRKSLFLLHICELTEATENSSISFCWHQFQSDTDNNSSRVLYINEATFTSCRTIFKNLQFPCQSKIVKNVITHFCERLTSAVLFMPVCRKLGNFWLTVIYTNFKQTLKTIHTGPFYQSSFSHKDRSIH